MQNIYRPGKKFQYCYSDYLIASILAETTNNVKRYHSFFLSIPYSSKTKRSVNQYAPLFTFYKLLRSFHDTDNENFYTSNFDCVQKVPRKVLQRKNLLIRKQVNAPAFLSDRIQNFVLIWNGGLRTFLCYSQ